MRKEQRDHKNPRIETMSHQQIGQIIRQARSQAGLTQGALGEQLGLKQSAISMMEQGKEHAISDRKLLKMGELLGLDLLPLMKAEQPAPAILKFCSSPDCFAHVPLSLAGQLVLMPSMVSGPAGELSRCQYCADPLEEKCGECEAPVCEASACMACGTAYVSAPEVADVGEDVARRQNRVRDFFALRQLLEANQERLVQSQLASKNLPFQADQSFEANQGGVRTDEADTGSTS